MWNTSYKLIKASNEEEAYWKLSTELQLRPSTIIRKWNIFTARKMHAQLSLVRSIQNVVIEKKKLKPKMALIVI